MQPNWIVKAFNRLKNDLSRLLSRDASQYVVFFIVNCYFYGGGKAEMPGGNEEVRECSPTTDDISLSSASAIDIQLNPRVFYVKEPGGKA